jgi:hypothetical protein
VKLVEIRLCTPLVSLNELKGRHWGQRAKLKAALVSELTVRRVDRLAPRHPPAELQIVHVERLLNGRAKVMDTGNIAGGSAKELVDSLTTLGFWRDDSPRFVDVRYHQRQPTAQEKADGIHTVVTIQRALS